MALPDGDFNFQNNPCSTITLPALRIRLALFTLKLNHGFLHYLNDIA